MLCGGPWSPCSASVGASSLVPGTQPGQCAALGLQRSPRGEDVGNSSSRTEGCCLGAGGSFREGSWHWAVQEAGPLAREGRVHSRRKEQRVLRRLGLVLSSSAQCASSLWSSLTISLTPRQGGQSVPGRAGHPPEAGPDIPSPCGGFSVCLSSGWNPRGYVPISPVSPALLWIGHAMEAQASEMACPLSLQPGPLSPGRLLTGVDLCVGVCSLPVLQAAGPPLHVEAAVTTCPRRASSTDVHLVWLGGYIVTVST